MRGAPSVQRQSAPVICAAAKSAIRVAVMAVSMGDAPEVHKSCGWKRAGQTRIAATLNRPRCWRELAPDLMADQPKARLAGNGELSARKAKDRGAQMFGGPRGFIAEVGRTKRPDHAGRGPQAELPVYIERAIEERPCSPPHDKQLSRWRSMGRSRALALSDARPVSHGLTSLGSAQRTEGGAIHMARQLPKPQASRLMTHRGRADFTLSGVVADSRENTQTPPQKRIDTERKRQEERQRPASWTPQNKKAAR